MSSDIADKIASCFDLADPMDVIFDQIPIKITIKGNHRTLVQHGPVRYKFTESIQLHFTNPFFPGKVSFSFPLSCRISTVRAFLARHIFYAPDAQMVLTLDSRVLPDSEPVATFSEQPDPTITTDGILQGDVPVVFLYQSTRFTITPNIRLFLAPGVEIPAVLRRLGALLNCHWFCLSLTSTDLFSGQPITFRTVHNRAAFLWQKSHHEKREIGIWFENNFPSPQLARLELGRHWNVADPETLRFTFHKQPIRDDQNLAFLRTRESRPIIVTLGRRFRFRFDSELFTLPCAENDKLSEIVPRIEALHSVSIQRLEYLRGSGAVKLLRMTDKIGIVKNKTVSVILAVKEKLITFVFSSGNRYHLTVSDSTIVKSFIGIFEAVLSTDFMGLHAHNIDFCDERSIIPMTCVVRNLPATVYCPSRLQKMRVAVAYPDGSTDEFLLSQVAHTSELRKLIQAKQPFVRFTISNEKVELVDDQRLCSIVFHNPWIVLSIDVTSHIFILDFSSVLFTLIMDRGLLLADLRACLTARFSFDSPDFALTLSGRPLADPLASSTDSPVIAVHWEGSVRQRLSFRDIAACPPVELGPHLFDLNATAADAIAALAPQFPGGCHFFCDGHRVLDTPDAPLSSVPFGPPSLSLAVGKTAEPVPRRPPARPASVSVSLMLPDNTLLTVMLPGSARVADALDQVRPQVDGADGVSLQVRDASATVIDGGLPLTSLEKGCDLFVVKVAELSIVDRGRDAAPAVHRVPTTFSLDAAFPGRRIANCHGVVVDSASLEWFREPQPFALVREAVVLPVIGAEGVPQTYEVDADAPVAAFLELLKPRGDIVPVDENGPVSGEAALAEVAGGLWLLPQDVAPDLSVPLVSGERRFHIRVDPRATIGDVKRLIADRFDTQAASIILQHKGLSQSGAVRVLRLSLSEEHPLVVLIHVCNGESPVEDGPPLARPQNYDELIRSLAAQSNQPLKVCQWCFNRHRFQFAETLAELTAGQEQ